MTHIDAITSYIHDDLLQGAPEVALTPDLNLLENGILDSLTLLRLVQFLQKRFEIKVDGSEIVPDNFRSIEDMAKFIDRKS